MDYGKHANSVLEVVDGLLEPFERSERGRCGGGGVRAVPEGADLMALWLQIMICRELSTM